MERFLRLRRRYLTRVAVAAALPTFLLFLTGCASSFGGDQNTFNPGGDVAKDQLDLFIIALVPAAIIMVLVFAVLIYAMLRYRRKSDEDPIPKQVHGNNRLEIAWTIAPTLLLIGLAIPMVASIIDLDGASGEDALSVLVIGQQFNWVFQYPDLLDADGKPLTITNGVLHIPVDREIDAALESQDVIHSFWVPKLAGKRDVVPGRTNRLPFNATEPGEFSGQCAEFCGLRHAFMKFTVIAHTEEEFEACIAALLAGEAEPAPCEAPSGG